MLSRKETDKIKKEMSLDQDRLYLHFRALGNPARFGIFKLLIERCGICVTDIANIFGMTIPAVSQHLKILEMLGLVKRARKGQMACYGIKGESPTVRRLAGIFKISGRVK